MNLQIGKFSVVDSATHVAEMVIARALLPLLAALAFSLAPLTARAVVLAVSTLEDELNNDGDCSLREAITATNTNTAVDACPIGEAGSNTISFSVSGTILLSSTLPVIEDHLILSGPGAGNLTISGNNSAGVLVVNAGISLTLNHLTIADSVASGVVNNGTLSVANSTFSNNKGILLDEEGNSAGGGIYNKGTLAVSNSTFSSNLGGNNVGGVERGGGIYNSGTVAVSDSTFSENMGGVSLTGEGGAIYSTGILSVTGSTFFHNAGDVAGGIFNTGTLSVTSSIFERNVGYYGAGGILNGGGAVSAVASSTFVDNSADDGGGITNIGTMIVSHSVFTSNSGIEEGGGIYNLGTLTVTSSTFLENSNDEHGGGGINNNGTATLSYSIFRGNRALSGGGIYNDDNGTLTVTHSIFDSNFAYYDGGGINNANTLVVSDSAFVGNSGYDPEGTGAGIRNAGTVVVSNSTFDSNSILADIGDDGVVDPAGSGGGIGNAGTLQIVNSTFSHNTTAAGGGIINRGGQVELTNTIIDENHGGDCAGDPLTSLGHNLDSDGSCSLTGPGDIPDGNANLAVAATGNGGPTPTVALLPGSDAIDAGDNAVCAAPPVNNLDQRGLPRTVDGDNDGIAVCDIGAYEEQIATGPAIIFADGFESGDLWAWSGWQRDGGDLRARSAAALVGNYGLLAEIDDHTMLAVVDDTPSTEPRYRARFYFDPNTLVMASGDAFHLLRGMAATWPAVLEVGLRYHNDHYQVRAGLLNDQITWRYSLWLTVSDAPHFLEVDWQASSAPGADDGALTFWIDGVQRSHLTGIDNDTRRIDLVRVGAISGLDEGTRGVSYFDAFESRRQSYIGAAAGEVVVAAHAAPAHAAELHAWVEEDMSQLFLPLLNH